MPSTLAKPYLLAGALGVLAGLRSMSPLFILSVRANRRPRALAGTPFARLATPRARAVLALAAGGELIGDKLPQVPARTVPVALAGRVVFGALAGAGVCLEGRRPAPAGALLGGLAAFAGSYGGYYLRRSLGRDLHLPSPLDGLAEDALAIALGRAIARA